MTGHFMNWNVIQKNKNVGVVCFVFKMWCNLFDKHGLNKLEILVMEIDQKTVFNDTKKDRAN